MISKPCAYMFRCKNCFVELMWKASIKANPSSLYSYCILSSCAFLNRSMYTGGGTEEMLSGWKRQLLKTCSHAFLDTNDVRLSTSPKKYIFEPSALGIPPFSTSKIDLLCW